LLINLILFDLDLVCASGGPASDPGRLSSSDITVSITVLASNNPYGVYVFANDSLRVSIAEDFSSETANASMASLRVYKTPGAADYVQVICHFYLLFNNVYFHKHRVNVPPSVCLLFFFLNIFLF